MEKKKEFCAENLEGLLPKSYCERLNCIARGWLYCDLEGVKEVVVYYNTLSILYFRDCWKCVAIQILYCRLLAGKAVSRYKICIVTEGLGLAGFWLQYKILYCG